MNLIKFLEKVDLIIASYDKETLKSCIHEAVRKLPEGMRDDFCKKYKKRENMAGGIFLFPH